MAETLNQLERRLFDRFSAKLPAKFKDTREEYGINVFLRDASALGVQICTRDHLFVNDRVVIEVKIPNCYFPLEVKGSVIWTRESSPAIWDAGIRFNRIDLVYASLLYKNFLAAQNL